MKNFIKSRSKGFSLIELLISITIIALLATIVLQNLSKSRERAYDSKVRQQLAGFRTAAEIYYSSREPNNYGPATTGCASGVFNNINPVNGSPALYIAEGNLPYGTQVVCQSSDTEYAVKASLYNGESYWCVDSKGAFRGIEGLIEGPGTFCP